ncbi:hypothetical protein CKC_03110 [Candidatus Liberibacter solanacearum CLso-ZC1]|uniref:Uncharacterized protein n=1 Tax=Liberibacter solanacearum (strain CLso-ZC1) TaxID=658172 RepID=E4UAY0_LIBSC|nr:hypothetical protein CKC_03110 [Candidatus Liberibacter solanacearum CLso-ZC1]
MTSFFTVSTVLATFLGRAASWRILKEDAVAIVAVDLIVVDAILLLLAIKLTANLAPTPMAGTIKSASVTIPNIPHPISPFLNAWIVP